MKKIIFLMIWGTLLISCTDEKPLGNFLDASTWRCIDVGAVHNDGGGLLYSYQEIYTIVFTNTTFELTMEGRYDKNRDGIYEEEEKKTTNGSYVFKYPETNLASDDGQFVKKITLESDVFYTEPDDKGKYLVFVKVRN